MITDSGLVRLHLEGSDGHCAAIPRERGEAWLAEYHPGGDWTLIPALACHCCGATEGLTQWISGQRRCAKHHGRNPCAIEGCKRTRAAPASGFLSCDDWLCHEHWRRYVPPGSRARRAYHTFFRRAKRHGGFIPELSAQFWRFWESLIKRARRRSTEGFIDQAEIERLMGWAGEG